MAIMEAYFDESGTHEGSPDICVAGYLFEKGNAIALDAAWRGMLKDKSLDCFRMSDCAHKTGPFKGWSESDTTNLEIRAIDLVRTCATHGFAASVAINDFHLIPKYSLFESAYSFACLQMFLGVQRWANANKFVGGVKYFFESGAQHESEADALMKKIFAHPQLKNDFRYSSHSFEGKANVVQLQCADLLAWHLFTYNRRKRQGEIEKRKDFRRLPGKRVQFNHYDKEGIEKWLTHSKVAPGSVN